MFYIYSGFTIRKIRVFFLFLFKNRKQDALTTSVVLYAHLHNVINNLIHFTSTHFTCLYVSKANKYKLFIINP